MNEELTERLRAIVGADGLLEADEVRKRPAGFLRTDTLQAGLLVRPRTTAEVAAVLKLCNQKKCAVVTQGGLTGLVHGADTTPEQIVLSLERMNTVEEIDPVQRVAVAQAGVTLQTMQESLEPHGLAFPLDLGARGSATLGGNAATNAGGNRVIRYGMMRAMVLGLEVVLADGTVISSLNRMLKNNAGYDLKHMFIGSEGTLGVITRLVLRLSERPRSQNVAFASLASFDALTAFLKHMDQALGGTLSAFEVMWRDFYELVTTPPAKSSPPLPHGSPFYVLVESLGADQEQDAARFVGALEKAIEGGLIADAVIAGSERECAGIWAMRDDVMQVARYGMPFTFDVSLPIAAMERYILSMRRTLSMRWPESHCWVFGHLGDGNLHVVVRTGNRDDRAEVERIVYMPLAGIGGSVSAEHGIGLEKKPYLPLSRTAEEVALMRTLKGTLDPNNILNPGKMLFT
ncbi:MAG TPA: FAD-binding oxidoreductase [Noviherbaspirillum sp.]|uniref:FAD-binding oxidoreductase n=1 Tax=Noviherbaspirillum sp. TaxID=1926288 RepID=UPI002B473D11|nr:FAD-binding oxidoreductase [Noviherbaspirillum sp.]HJV85272.1 FAD-binding oxidoreductase [Noviherbaspirillum sp.]